MIKGIGIDICELDRIEEAMKNNSRFIHRILTEKEREKLDSITSWKRKVEYTAGRFAVKEAYAKANGTGIGKELSFQDIEVVSHPNGKPEILIKGVHNPHVFLSISHSSSFVVAQVVIEVD